MNDDVMFSGSVLRVFEARAKPGCVKELARRLTSISIDVVQNEPGNQGHLIGKKLTTDGDDLVFVSVWKDIAAIKVRFGEDWEASYLPPGYADLIDDFSVTHITLQNDWLSGRGALKEVNAG